MTQRERMLATIYGKPVDSIPWAPRMDLWYIANQAKGTLPDKFAGLNTVEIARDLNVACHSVRADFTIYRSPREHLMLRGFGLDTHPDYPYRVKVFDLKTNFHCDEENFITVMQTPAGKVTTHIQQTSQMAQDGISLTFVKTYPIKSYDDFEAVAEVFDHLKVIVTPEAYSAFQRRIGDWGLAVAAGLYAASPIHLMLHDLMPMDQFFYFYHDNRDSLYKLADRMVPFFEAVLDAVISCDAEVIYWGSNYDQNLTWPSFFHVEIEPWLKRVSKRVHEAGKLLLTHTDGENKALLPFYPSCGFDIAESVCTQPMTQCKLAEVREGMGPKTTVWGGIPSITLLDESMNEYTFEVYLDDIFRELGSGERLIFGVSDNVPPDANLSRLEGIKQRIEDYGPVHPA